MPRGAGIVEVGVQAFRLSDKEHMFEMYRRHTPVMFEEVRRLSAGGLSDYAVARTTGVPRSTVQKWRTGGAPSRGSAAEPKLRARPDEPAPYSYLLGVYLGDGHLSVYHGRSAELRIYMDAAYPHLSRLCRESIKMVVPETRAAHSPHRVAARDHPSFSPALPPRADPLRWLALHEPVLRAADRRPHR